MSLLELSRWQFVITVTFLAALLMFGTVFFTR